MLGGLESPVGAVVGGLALGVFLNLVGQYVGFATSELRLPIAFAVLLVVLLVKPTGLFGRKAGEARMRRVAAGARRRRARRRRARAAAVHARAATTRGSRAHVAIYFIAILGLNILTGYTGQISIGHGAFMAIGGYTTAVMSHDHHTNLVATLPMAFAIAFVCGVARRASRRCASPASTSRSRRSRSPSRCRSSPLKFSKFLGGSERHPDEPRPSAHLWLYVGRLDVRRDPLRRSPGSSCAGGPAAPSAPSATARSPPPRPGSSLPIYKTLAFGVSAAFAGVAGSLFVLATNGFAQPNEFGVLLSLQILIGAAVAGLGSLWGVLVGAVFIGLLPDDLVGRAADRLDATARTSSSA